MVSPEAYPNLKAYFVAECGSATTCTIELTDVKRKGQEGLGNATLLASHRSPRYILWSCFGTGYFSRISP
jgi:hypothetical protein